MSKNYTKFLSIIMIGLAVSGCETVNGVFSGSNTTTRSVSAANDSEPALVIEAYDEQPSQWKPILPHELDAHIEEMELLLSLLRYSRRITGFSAQELDQEYQKLNKTTADAFRINEKMRLALLLSMPGSKYQDYEQAKHILSDVLNKSHKRAPVLREYAYTLLVNIEQDNETSQQNYALRKKLKQEITRRQKAEKTNRALETTRKQLEQKLEALKTIEETITKRQNEPEEIAP
jgi:hypothetical protein